MRPVALEPNLLRRPYRGGSTLADFRNMGTTPDERCPEDWVASTTTVFGDAMLGLSALPDGRTLRAAIEAEPELYLGPEHAETFGSDSALLLKLIDAQQRLSVHIHPSRDFSRRELGTPYGKTEAWYVLSTSSKDPSVFFGFTEDVASHDLLATVESGRGHTLLERMNKLSVKPGDCVFVPAGTAHAIGEGVFLVEVQEPSDLLVRLEWNGYAVGAMPNDLGLGFERALAAVDRRAWGDQRIAAVRTTAVERATNRFTSVLPPSADAYFRLEHATIDGRMTVDAAYSVLVVVRGFGELVGSFGSVPVHSGMTVLVPHAAGQLDVSGDVDLVRARPASSSSVHENDPDLIDLLHREHGSTT